MDEALKRVINLIALTVAVASVVLIAMGRLSWATGLLASTAWSVINFLLLMNIFGIAMLQKSRKKLLAVLLIKFPILYLIGYLILSSKLFPLSSILTGLITLIILGVVTIWPKQT
ncbi:MAG: hypothetical protein Q8O36_03185 [Candidatus Omnitrophota bacterium]|nr:hypothetical protein [Candidatus Omnitrophota bacterium]